MNYRIIFSGAFFLSTVAASQEPLSTSKHFSISHTFKTVFTGVKKAFSPPSSKANSITDNPVLDLTKSGITDDPQMDSSPINFFQEITADSVSEAFKAYKKLPESWQTEAVINCILQQAEEISQYPHFTGPEMIDFLAAYGIDTAEKNRFYGLCNKQYGYEKDIPSAQAELQHALLQGKRWAKETLYEAYSYGWYGYAQNIEEAKNLLKEFSSNTANSSSTASPRKSSKRRKELIIPLHLSPAEQYKHVCEYFGLPVS
ncbi:MAG: hypothetical protein K0M45_04220 [Candidatus Paracaedibacteraceae bacterium]|nr:hypothetical protein [Candidatus Paracaedibacteraceae bacterium]